MGVVCQLTTLVFEEKSNSTFNCEILAVDVNLDCAGLAVSAPATSNLTSHANMYHGSTLAAGGNNSDIHAAHFLFVCLHTHN